MLDSSILEQVKGVFASLSSDITLSVTRNSNDENSAEFSSFVEENGSPSVFFAMVKRLVSASVVYQMVTSLPRCSLLSLTLTDRVRTFLTRQ